MHASEHTKTWMGEHTHRPIMNDGRTSEDQGTCTEAGIVTTLRASHRQGRAALCRSALKLASEGARLRAKQRGVSSLTAYIRTSKSTLSNTPESAPARARGWRAP